MFSKVTALWSRPSHLRTSMICTWGCDIEHMNRWGLVYHATWVGQRRPTGSWDTHTHKWTQKKLIKYAAFETLKGNKRSQVTRAFLLTKALVKQSTSWQEWGSPVCLQRLNGSQSWCTSQGCHIAEWTKKSRKKLSDLEVEILRFGADCLFQSRHVF